MSSRAVSCCLSGIVFATPLAILLVILVTSTPRPAGAAEQSFPFGSELMLDVAPLYGSKRVPMIEIEENGSASIDLWCASAEAQVSVGSGSITIAPGDIAPAQCTPERQTGDQNLIAALSQVTNWRRDGDIIEFVGPSTLRFRLMTN